MTLGVISHSLQDQDQLFSEALRQHARSLDLTKLMATGDWDFGQGIRKARGETFFWDLRSAHFSPFGLNHPLVLSTIASKQHFATASTPFNPDLIQIFPALSDWSWTILEKNNPWLNQQKNIFSEDCTLKADLGWQGFSQLFQMTTWVVELDENLVWVASRNLLPNDGTQAAQHRSWLKLFLTADIHAPEGRLQEVRQILQTTFPEATLHGLNVVFSKNQLVGISLSSLAYDSLEDGIQLCFPLSFLPKDLAGIAHLFKH